MVALRYKELTRRPKAADFRSVIEKAKEIGEANDEIDWIIILGSALQGTVTPASDLDLVLGLKPDLNPAQVGLLVRDELGDLADYAWKSKIPLNPSIVTAEEFQSGNHTLGPGYVAHVRWSATKGGQIYGDPTTLKSAHDSAYREALAYVIWKLRKARTMLMYPTLKRNDDIWYSEWLSDTLSVWRYVAMRLIELEGLSAHSLGELSDTFLNLMSQRGAACGEDLGTFYVDLASQRRRYTVELERQMELRDRARWEAMLREVEMQGDILHDFLHHAQNYLTDYAIAKKCDGGVSETLPGHQLMFEP